MHVAVPAQHDIVASTLDHLRHDRLRPMVTQSVNTGASEDKDLPAQPQTAGGSVSKTSRAPMPRKFRDRRSLDGRSVSESSTSTQRTQDHERTISLGILVACGAASPQSAGAGGTFSVTPTSPRAQRAARPSTLRDSSRRVQRWSSVDEVALNGNGNSPSRDDPDGRRQSRHAGSTESPLGGGEGRSVVGEGLRAAGLPRRGSEDVFTEVGMETWTGIAQIVIGLPNEEQDPRTPTSASGSVRYGAARNIHSVLPSGASRAGTSLGSYGADEEGPRMTPLRTYRSSYALPENDVTTRPTTRALAYLALWPGHANAIFGARPANVRLPHHVRDVASMHTDVLVRFRP
ncbi:hypothetical protein JB92DRAFT_3115325 [Gautieria morchelliformis]|nr:hypothetical protein JB92DRAFT_3115325 [Gautieria morchelliformis]